MGFSRMSLLGEVSWVSYKHVILFPLRIYEKLRLIYLWRGGLRTPLVISEHVLPSHGDGERSGLSS